MATTMKVGAAASVVLLAAASAFFWLARDTESEAYRAAADAIRQVRLLATEWSVETARARTDPMGDYDALAAFIPEVARLKEAILGTVRETAMPERLANEVYAFASALDAKEERVERFKTANSVIRNSVRYLPHAATGIAQSAADAELVQDVTTLADGLGEYAASPTDAAKGRLAAIRDRLAERQEALSGDLGDAVERFLAHAEILLERQGPTERIFRQATSNDVSRLASDLVAEFEALSANLERRADMFTNGVWAAAVALLLVWVFVIATRSRMAPSAAADTVVADVKAPPAAASEVAANGNGVPHEHPDAVAKLLMSQRILTEAVSSDIAQAARGLHTDNGGDATADVERIAALAERLATASSSRDARYALVDPEGLRECGTRGHRRGRRCIGGQRTRGGTAGLRIGTRIVPDA